MTEREQTVDLRGCARCRGDGHEGLIFRPLTYPVEAGDVTLTHWAPCPTNGEPILMGHVDRAANSHPRETA